MKGSGIHSILQSGVLAGQTVSVLRFHTKAYAQFGRVCVLEFDPTQPSIDIGRALYLEYGWVASMHTYYVAQICRL